MGMSDKKILSVLALYDKKLEALRRTERWDDNKQLEHLVEMIPQIQSFLKEDRREKAFRWLGFMQGALWSNGIYTIDEMAEHNRPRKSDVREAYQGHSLDRYTTCSMCGDLDGCHKWRELEEVPDDLL